MLDTWQLAALLVAAFGAGLVDAVAGGGGLIQVPALFSTLPAEAPATIFGTNKGSSVFGTANAAWRYARRIDIPWRTTLAMAGAAFLSSFVGAAFVAWLPRDVVRPLVLPRGVHRSVGCALSAVAPVSRLPRRGLLPVAGRGASNSRSGSLTSVRVASRRSSSR